MVERDDVRRSYDELAATYATQRIEDGRGTEILDGFLDSLGDPRRILDAGCGQGTPVLSRISADTSAVGVDFSREQLRLADGNTPDAALTQGDMTDLPFADGVFDAVVAYWSLIHVPMAAHQRVIDEFARVLCPGGHVLLCEGTNEWAGENPDWLNSGVSMAWDIAGAERTRSHLRASGFSVIERWGIPDSLDADEDGEDDRADGDEPWTVFDARLDG
ncbi:class I SAM-dependent methyltransferase [Haloarcula amylovorans]|uniref:class I SAM-dependent methyltransferase n=1 Tax=Haloarcula amylovorans TaxID=2562280 RepID=UPI001075D2F5|nr:class I SAM-dependent methyltransferase [Halomicroarcula amylolytica]